MTSTVSAACEERYEWLILAVGEITEFTVRKLDWIHVMFVCVHISADETAKCVLNE